MIIKELGGLKGPFFFFFRLEFHGACFSASLMQRIMYY